MVTVKRIVPHSYSPLVVLDLGNDDRRICSFDLGAIRLSGKCHDNVAVASLSYEEHWSNLVRKQPFDRVGFPAYSSTLSFRACFSDYDKVNINDLEATLLFLAERFVAGDFTVPAADELVNADCLWSYDLSGFSLDFVEPDPFRGYVVVPTSRGGLTLAASAGVAPWFRVGSLVGDVGGVLWRTHVAPLFSPYEWVLVENEVFALLSSIKPLSTYGHVGLPLWDDIVG